MRKSDVLCRLPVVVSAAFVVAGAASPAWANVYASGLEKVDDDTVRYVLNENASSVKFEVWQVDGGKVDEETKTDSDYTTTGTHTWGWDGMGGSFGQEYTVKIIASKDGYGDWTPISDDNNGLLKFYFPVGVDVNRNPGSKYFGWVYVSEGIGGPTSGGRTTVDGLYALKADQSEVASGRTGGVSWDTGGDNSNWYGASPYKVTVAPDNHVFIADWSDSHPGVWIANAELSGNFSELLVPGNANHGSVAGIWLEGTESQRKMYTMDEDYGQRGDVQRYDIGTTSSSYSANPTAVVHDDPNYIQNGKMDLARDEDGSWWLAQYRYTDGTSCPALSHWNDGATSPSWESGSLHCGYGSVAIDNARNRVAVGARSGYGVYVLSISNPSSPGLETTLSVSSYNRDVAFDAAGNVYYVNSGIERLRIISPPGSNSYTTESYFTLPPNLVNISVTPNSGTWAVGEEKTFTCVVRDQDGYADVNYGYFGLQDTWGIGECLIHWREDDGLLGLYQTGGFLYGYFGSGGTLNNGYVSVNCDTSSMTGSGNDLTLNIKITLITRYDNNAVNVELEAYDTGNVHHVGPEDFGDLTLIECTPPDAPSNPGATGITTSAITWTWTDNSTDETGFKVYADPGSGAPATLRTTTAANAESWNGYTGLSANTQHSFQVAATNGYCDSAKTSNFSKYTLANVPGAPTVDNPSETTLEVTISQNGNPSNTTYSIRIDGSQYVQSDGTVGGSEVFQTYAQWGGASGVTVSGLTCGTTYTFDTRAKNGDGVATNWSSTGQNSTSPCCTPPSITAHPTSQTKCAGESVTFSVTASGTAPLSYQWRKNGGNIGGATGISYTIAPVTTGDAANYDCVVTNSCGSDTSNAATLTVNTAPSITTHPTSQTKCAGESVTFSVSASGTEPLSYQWRKGGESIGGATGTSYTIASVTTGHAGSYDCVVSNSCGSDTSDAATLTVNETTSITAHPADATKCPGETATFSVTADGSNLSYQWELDSGGGFGGISGATDSSYTTPSLAAGDNGNQYRCVVTGDCGSETSSAAILTMNQATQITQHPVSQSECPGSNVEFSVQAVGTNLSYQWKKDGGELGGETSCLLTLGGITSDDAGDYTCVVGGDCGSETSDAATLTVKAATTITGHPQDQTVLEGGTATFEVSATGEGTLTYQWEADTGAGYQTLTGETSSTLVITDVEESDTGSYRCQVSAECGSVTSDAATLAINPEMTGGWSIREHDNGVGELAITLDRDNVVTEPRRYGIQKVVVQFSEAVEPVDGTLDDNDVSISDSDSNPYTATSLALVEGGTKLQALFDAGVLPDQKRYTFEVLANKFKKTGTSVLLGGDTDCEIRSLVGDVNGDGNTDLIDMARVKSKNREAVDVTNAGDDVNVSGRINLVDMALVRSLNGNSAP